MDYLFDLRTGQYRTLKGHEQGFKGLINVVKTLNANQIVFKSGDKKDETAYIPIRRVTTRLS